MKQRMCLLFFAFGVPLIVPPTLLASILDHHLPEIALMLFLFTFALVFLCFRNHFKVHTFNH